jgi:hypothetical protein
MPISIGLPYQSVRRHTGYLPNKTAYHYGGQDKAEYQWQIQRHKQHGLCQGMSQNEINAEIM